MKKIGLIVLGLMIICNVGVLWAEDPTPEQIMQKVADNMGLLQDMKAKAIYNGSYQGNPYPADEIRLFWVKAPDKSKTMSLKDGYIEIINGNYQYRIDNSTQTISLLDYGIAPSQLDYSYHLAEFKTKHILTITNTETINGETLYTIEAKPLQENAVYSKLVLKVNYESSLVLVRELYGVSSQKESRDEVLDYKAYSLSEEICNLPTKTRYTAYFADGEIISQVEYNDIELNTGLDDSIFTVE